MGTGNDRVRNIEEMMRLQETLNAKTNGENGRTARRKTANLSTGIEQYTWNWWDSWILLHGSIGKTMKKSTGRTPKRELVDAWHFVLSLALSRGFSAEEIGSRYFSYEEFTGDEDACMDDPLFVAENLISLCASNSTHLCDRNASAIGNRMSVSMIVTLFGYLAKSFGMDFEDLYSVYTTKNILNKFRNDMGYAEGMYRKIWAGKEDNEWVREFALKKRSPEELYEALKKFHIEEVEKGD